MAPDVQSLSEKEKQTLRLLLVGHDAKSIARQSGLSVHTIHERLRDARRKLAASSSREAARLLHEAEAASQDNDPEKLGDKPIGDDPVPTGVAAMAPPEGKPRPLWQRPFLIGGVFVMSLFIAALAASMLTTEPATAVRSEAVASNANAEAVEAARQWLALVDASRWNESWQGTANSFRQLNTVQVWTEASQQARTPLGAMLSRRLTSVDDVPAPPAGYMMVRFRTDFANRAAAVETLTLVREDGQWRVSGIYIE